MTDDSASTERAAARSAQRLARRSDDIRTMVETLFVSVGQSPPVNPNLENWIQLCHAVATRTSLHSVLPPQLTEFRRYEDVHPVRPTRTYHAPDDASLEQAFARAWEYLVHFEDLATSANEPNPPVMVPRLG